MVRQTHHKLRMRTITKKYAKDMKLKNKFAIKEVLGVYIAVAVGKEADEFNGVIRLENESTKRMFELLQEEKEVEEIVSIMLDEYDVEEPILREELNKLIDKLREEERL